MILKCKKCEKEKYEPQPNIVGWYCCEQLMLLKQPHDCEKKT